MEKLRLMKSDCVETLKNSIGENLERYRTGEFGPLIVDFEIGVSVDMEALAALQHKDGDDLKDAENCEIVYSCLGDISPYVARDERLWAHLCHGVLIDYCRNRWPIPQDDKKAVSHIKSHFFASEKRTLEARNSVSRLYWLSHMAARVTDIPLVDTLRIVMEKTDVRANFIERPTVLQAESILIAVVHNLKDSLEKDSRLFERENFRELQRRLNEYCGYVLVECLPENVVRKLVDEMVGNILQENAGSTAETSIGATMAAQPA